MATLIIINHLNKYIPNSCYYNSCLGSIYRSSKTTIIKGNYYEYTYFKDDRKA